MMVHSRALLMGLLLFPIQGAEALFLCTDPGGQQVFTDAPRQFLRCTSVGADLPDPPPNAQRSLERPSIPRTVGPSGAINADPLTPTAHADLKSAPLERMGGLLLVTVRLNHDRSAKLILDTGAFHSLLSHRIAQDLGLLSFPPVALVTLQTVGGSVQAEVVNVEVIQLADAEVRHSLAAIHDLPDAPPGVEGLLGQSFLGQFEVTVNAAKGELWLRPTK